MPIPLGALIAMQAGSQILGQLGQGINNRNAQRNADRQAQADRDFTRERDRASMAGEESMADPFRHTLSQLQAAQLADQIANTTQRTVNIPGLRPEFRPQLGGGYQPSQEMRGAGNAARSAILSGQGTAPSMTNPNNYGQTGLLDLIAAMLGQQAPGGAAPIAGAPAKPGAMMPPGLGPTAPGTLSGTGRQPGMPMSATAPINRAMPAGAGGVPTMAGGMNRTMPRSPFDDDEFTSSLLRAA